MSSSACVSRATSGSVGFRPALLSALPMSRRATTFAAAITTMMNAVPMAQVGMSHTVHPPARLLRCEEAPVGIEPTNRGFADLCLTTWLRRRGPRKWLEHYAFSTHLDGALFGARQLGALLGAVLQELKLSEDSLSLRPPSPRARDPTRQ